MHSLVGWAKAPARPSTQMRASRAPCSPTESMRAGQLLVGTAHARLSLVEKLCRRLCPPYDSPFGGFGRTKPARAAMSLHHDPPLHPGTQRAVAHNVIHHLAGDWRRVCFGEHRWCIGEHRVAVAATG